MKACRYAKNIYCQKLLIVVHCGYAIGARLVAGRHFFLIHSIILVTSIFPLLSVQAKSNPSSFQLPNGLRFFHQVRPISSMSAVSLWIKAGAAEELNDEFGAAHFVEHMLFKGSKGYPDDEADRQLELLGGTFAATTLADFVHIDFSVPSENLLPSLAILFNILRNSDLTQEAMDVERKVILNELALSQGDVFQQMLQKAYSVSATQSGYGHSTGGMPDQIRSLKLDALFRFYKRCFKAENCALFITDNSDAEAILKRVDELTLGWIPLRTSEPVSALSQLYKPFRGKVQLPSNASGALLALPVLDTSRQMLEVGQIVTEVLDARLNGSTSERFKSTVRFTPRLHASLIILMVDTSNARGGITTDQLVRVWNQMKTLPPSQNEVSAAAKRLRSRSYFDQESSSLATKLLGQALLFMKTTPELMMEDFQRITPNDIQRFWGKVSKLENRIVIQFP